MAASLTFAERGIGTSTLPPLSPRRRVLVVEDETLIAMDLQGRLQSLGYEVPAIADTAEMAVELAGSCHPDLILMDIRLREGSDGIAAAAAVREKLDIPVIFITSHSDAETLERAKLSDPFGYIVKPLGSVNFRAVIDIALQNHSTESSLRKTLTWHNARERTRLMRLFQDYTPSMVSPEWNNAPDWPRNRTRFEEALIEALPEPGILVGHDGKIRLANARAARLFGYDSAELQGTSLHVILPEQFRGFTECSTNGAAGGEKASASAERVRKCHCLHKSGRELPVEISACLIDTDTGPLVLAVFRERGECQRATIDQELLAAMVNGSQSAIIGETLDGIIATWNNGAERLYGYAAEDIIGHPATVLLPGDHREQAPAGRAALGADGWKQEETVRRTKDGRLIDVSQIVSPIRDAAGKLIGISTIAMEVSEHVRGEARFRGLLEASPDAVIVVDRDGRIVLANARVEKIFGYTREELLEKSIDILIPQRFREQHPALRAGFFDTPDVRSMGQGQTLYCLRKDGREFPAEMSLGPLETREGILVSTTIRDITERKLAEEKIRRTLQEKDVMLNEIHHRVKNNLQVVSSLLNLQSDHVQDPVARRMFADSQTRIQSMALIHQQLYLSSNFAEIDFAPYLRALANHLLTSYAADDFTCTAEIDAVGAFLSLEEAIPCGLIVNELVSNSLKHSFRGRSAGEIRVGFNTADGVCVLTVDDDGVPLPNDLFTRRPPTMGVRLVQALATQLRGDLRVGYSPKFTVTFSKHPH